MGLTTLATLSDGTEIENPRWTRRHEERIAARIAYWRGSKNVRRTASSAASTASRSPAGRECTQELFASRLQVACGHYDLIAHEALNIKGMAQSNFAKSIMDAAWSILLSQVRYKAESAGVYAIAVNPRGTSHKCVRVAVKTFPRN